MVSGTVLISIQWSSNWFLVRSPCVSCLEINTYHTWKVTSKSLEHGDHGGFNNPLTISKSAPAFFGQVRNCTSWRACCVAPFINKAWYWMMKRWKGRRRWAAMFSAVPWKMRIQPWRYGEAIGYHSSICMWDMCAQWIVYICIYIMCMYIYIYIYIYIYDHNVCWNFK